MVGNHERGGGWGASRRVFLPQEVNLFIGESGVQNTQNICTNRPHGKSLRGHMRKYFLYNHVNKDLDVIQLTLGSLPNSCLDEEKVINPSIMHAFQAVYIGLLAMLVGAKTFCTRVDAIVYSRYLSFLPLLRASCTCLRHVLAESSKYPEVSPYVDFAMELYYYWMTSTLMGLAFWILVFLCCFLGGRKLVCFLS